ncbi:hypothetical protein CH380_10695 [Leptospira adleri]|uniref:Uncharacterized protein n=1 Tax=Leptospira adleri TaxID=2023186 RepID=A0A2M9YNZ3_9LEPT|nr:hypothetical protein CH380_10695 [Leptospira adleri]PJZ63925.1 hypothetical protein CH376_00415 [Leptospira adleri]
MKQIAVRPFRTLIRTRCVLFLEENRLTDLNLKILGSEGVPTFGSFERTLDERKFVRENKMRFFSKFFPWIFKKEGVPTF